MKAILCAIVLMASFSIASAEENPYHPFDGHGDNPFEFCKGASKHDCLTDDWFAPECHWINGNCEAKPHNCRLANNKEMCEWYPNTCVPNLGCKVKGAEPPKPAPPTRTPRTYNDCDYRIDYELYVNTMCEDPNSSDLDRYIPFCMEGHTDEEIVAKIKESEEYKNCPICNNGCVPLPVSSEDEENYPYHPFDGHGDNPFEFCKGASENYCKTDDWTAPACHWINGKCEARPHNCYLANNKEMCEWYPNTCVPNHGCKVKPPAPNPCLKKRGGCSKWGICTNDDGKAVCTCKPGYTGSGKACWRIRGDWGVCIHNKKVKNKAIKKACLKKNEQECNESKDCRVKKPKKKKKKKKGKKKKGKKAQDEEEEEVGMANDSTGFQSLLWVALLCGGFFGIGYGVSTFMGRKSDTAKYQTMEMI